RGDEMGAVEQQAFDPIEKSQHSTVADDSHIVRNVDLQVLDDHNLAGTARGQQKLKTYRQGRRGDDHRILAGQQMGDHNGQREKQKAKLVDRALLETQVSRNISG